MADQTKEPPAGDPDPEGPPEDEHDPDDVWLFESPKPPRRSAWQWFKKTFFGTEARRIASYSVIFSAAVAVILALVFSSGGGTPKSIVVNGHTFTAPPSAESAVDEIAKRPFWSSPPIIFPEANKAVGSEEPLPLSDSSITSAPDAMLATKFATEPEALARPENYLGERRDGVVAVVGKIVNAETLTSTFVHAAGDDSHGLHEVTQVDLQVLDKTLTVYAEFPGEAPSSGVVIVLGRLAALGSTLHNKVKAAYLLAERADSLNASVDSNTLRELYEDARRGKTEEQARAERLKRETAAAGSSGVSLFP
jgi:hypothetical protein